MSLIDRYFNHSDKWNFRYDYKTYSDIYSLISGSITNKVKIGKYEIGTSFSLVTISISRYYRSQVTMILETERFIETELFKESVIEYRKIKKL